MSNGSSQSETARTAFAELLTEFRQGRIADRKFEREAIRRHLSKLTLEWNQKFPGLPKSKFPYASYIGVSRRGARDKFLKKVATDLLGGRQKDGTSEIIVNPACVFGRHARDLAAKLSGFKVIATDINSGCNWFYGFFFRWKN